MPSTNIASLDSVDEPLKFKSVNPITNGMSKLIAESGKKAAVSENPSNDEVLPGCSYQTENRQDVIRRWLWEIHSRLFFLAKNDSSISFTSFVVSLQSQLQGEVSEKTVLEFLLALDDFFSANPPLSVPSCFFVEKLLETYRLLLNTYRECAAKISLVGEMEGGETNREKDRLQSLKKETEARLKEREELNAKEANLLQLANLVNDLEKFRCARDRNFANEINVNKTKLEICEKELAAIKIGFFSLPPDVEQQDNVEQDVNIKIAIRNVNYKLDDLQQTQDVIDEFESKIIKKQKELEESREGLLFNLRNFSPKLALMKQLESKKCLESKGNNQTSWLFSERKKIKEDLQANQRSLDEITDVIKMTAESFSGEGNDKISYFVRTLRDNLRLGMQKKTLTEKQEKTIKQSQIYKRNLDVVSESLAKMENDRTTAEAKLDGTKFYEALVQEKDQLKAKISSFEEQSQVERLCLDSIKSEHDKNQSELISLLNENNQELFSTLKQLLEKEIETYEEDKKRLTEEKEALEIFYKSNELVVKISDLQARINKIKQDAYVWGMLTDLDIKQYLEYLEYLENWSVGIQTEMRELQEKINELEKKMHEEDTLQEKKEKKLKVDRLRKQQLQYKSKLASYAESLEAGEQAAKVYRMEIKNSLHKIVSDIHCKIQQNEKKLLSNLKDREIVELKIKRSEAEEQLFHVVESEKNKRITGIEKDLFSRVFSVLSELKEEVDCVQWNTCGWGFFCKKVPDGIQRIRSFLNKIVNELPSDSEGCFLHQEQNLFMLVSFSNIYHLIRQKNSSKKCLRSPAVKRFYQSKGQLLESLYEELESEMDPSWFSTLLANIKQNSSQIFDFLNNDLFKECTFSRRSSVSP